jgi:BlaI family transcriptional regulator, penicillinase repressor
MGLATTYVRQSHLTRLENMTELHLTQRELDIMSVLWDLGEATVTEVRDAVDPNLAYTSISSMVRTLEIKGYVAHRRGEGKTHVYYPVVDPETAGESALKRVLDKIYGGSPIKLLAHLMEQRKVSEAELTRMRELLKKPPKKR